MNRLSLFILAFLLTCSGFAQKRKVKPADRVIDKINISKMPEGAYALEVYKVGYRSNDAYTSYHDLGRPNQLTKQQVEQIKKLNDGSPVFSEIVKVKAGTAFLKELDIRENDVFFLSFRKL